MALPTLFAAQTLSTGAQLDGNFAALGAITVIPCTIAGTNLLTLSPLANTPTVNNYAAGMLFGAIDVVIRDLKWEPVGDNYDAALQDLIYGKSDLED